MVVFNDGDIVMGPMELGLMNSVDWSGPTCLSSAVGNPGLVCLFFVVLVVNFVSLQVAH